MHYFNVRCVDKHGSVVKLEARLVHPDVETFGTERYFAWKLLSDFVSPEDDGDDVTLARKLIKRVEVGPLEHGTETARGPGWFAVARESDDDDELPTVVYTIEVSDPSLIQPLEVGDSEESVAYVETDKVILDTPSAESAWRRFECTEGGSSKFWQVRLDGSMVHLRWGKLGTEGRTQEDDWLSPERAQKAFAKLVAEKLKKGYVEVGPRGGAAAPALEQTPEKASKAKDAKAKDAKAKDAKAKDAKAKDAKAKDAKAKGDPPASAKKAGQAEASEAAASQAKLAPKTYDDVRAAVLSVVREEARNTPDELIACVVRWSEGASDEQVSAWLDLLDGKEKGWFSQAAGRVAVQRALAGDPASARRFLAAGEQALPSEELSDRAQGMLGLMAAWWRLGEAAKADAAWAALPSDPASYVKQKDMAWVAALGGQVEPFVSFGEIGGILDFATVEGLVALYADGPEVFCDAVERCEEKSDSAELSESLLRRLLAEGRPGAFVELGLRLPEILGSGGGEDCVVIALEALRKTDPGAAVKLALRVLADEDSFSFGYRAHPYAFGLVARHAPEEAVRWAEQCAELADEEVESRLAYLAAWGRTEEVRAALRGLDDSGVLLKVAVATPDRALATEAARAYVDKHRKKLGEIPVSALARLSDLGERAYVDALLEGELARLEALAPKDRDSGCRALCLRAATLGRLDLARKASNLPTKSVRYCSVMEMMRGCASVADYAGALAGFELLDDRSTAHQAAIMVVRVADAAFARGPRALPFRALAEG